MLKKIVILTGVLGILLALAALLLQIFTPGGPVSWLYTLAALVMAVVFTPLFFINHKKTFDAYKIPCYTMSAIIGALLMIGALLSGVTGALGEPNIYSGIFLLLCFLLTILFFKPQTVIKTVLIIQIVLMAGAILSIHLVNVPA